jgi:hypothetical protein
VVSERSENSRGLAFLASYLEVTSGKTRVNTTPAAVFERSLPFYLLQILSLSQQLEGVKFEISMLGITKANFLDGGDKRAGN